MGQSFLRDKAAELDRQQSSFPWKNKGIQWQYMQEFKRYPPYKYRVQQM